MKTEDTAEILKLILDTTQQTGTTAYKLPNPVDHDRFCTQRNFDNIVRRLRQDGDVQIEETSGRSGGSKCTCGSHSIKFQLGGELFNIFVVPDDQLEMWETITTMVSVACKPFPRAAANKNLRVHLFRLLKEELIMWQNLSLPAKETEPGTTPAPVGRPKKEEDF